MTAQRVTKTTVVDGEMTEISRSLCWDRVNNIDDVMIWEECRTGHIRFHVASRLFTKEQVAEVIGLLQLLL